MAWRWRWSSVQPARPLGIVRLPGQRRDALVDLGQPLGVHAAVQRVQRAGEIGGPLVECRDRRLDLGEQLPLRRRQPVEQLEDRLPVALHLLDRPQVGAEILGLGRRELARHPRRALDQRGLDRVRSRGPGQHVAPAVAGLPELRIVPEHPDAHPEHGEQEPGVADPGGDVDPQAAERDGRPARELTPGLLHDPAARRYRAPRSLSLRSRWSRRRSASPRGPGSGRGPSPGRAPRSRRPGPAARAGSARPRAAGATRGRELAGP